MEDLCYFDVLRCDKSIATAGLEVRVPFAPTAVFRVPVVFANIAP